MTEETRYETLIRCWNSIEEKSFDRWIIDFSDAFHKSRLSTTFVANILGVRLAELQAALALAVLDDEELELLAKRVPPKTTWFSLATANREGLEAALVALEHADGDSPFKKVEGAIRTIAGPSSLERVAALPFQAFEHAAKKAEAYGLLTATSRNALKNWARQQRTGRGLTVKQTAYAKNLLEQLADSNAIVRNSRDGDQQICDVILNAIDRP